ncbi:MAG: hypothetical protein JEZ07_12225 [Phycisphaerae bacterium]|nr:hypothetical protein [Phycisphaerae bacterium]
MGLDMYLEKSVWIGANYEHNEVTGIIDLKSKGKLVKVNTNKVKSIIEDYAYWRKANQIHGWFVRNVQDGQDNCARYYVSVEQMEELVDTCLKVLADHSLAPDLLPAQEGFFFGNAKYDEYYFDDLRATVAMLKNIKADSQDADGFYYYASW